MYTTETICVFIYQYCKRSTTYIISNGTNREADILPPFCNMSVSANASAPIMCEGHAGDLCFSSAREAVTRRWLNGDWATHLSDMIVPNSPNMEHLYPYSLNLSEEMNLLFISARAAYEEIMDDFRRNGQDSEYCPDSDSEYSGGCFRGPGSRTRLRNGVHGLGLRRGSGSGAAPPPPPPPSSAGLVLRGGLPQHVSTSAYAAFALSLMPPSSAAAASVNGNGHMCCAFCRKNGETHAFYSGHMLKDAKGRVTCPILRAYTCPYCGANGDKAHTVKYCPVNITSETAMVTLSREDTTRGSTSPCRAASDTAFPGDIGRRRRYRRSH